MSEAQDKELNEMSETAGIRGTSFDTVKIENILSTFEHLLNNSKVEDNTSAYFNSQKKTINDLLEDDKTRYIKKINLPRDFKMIHSIDDIEIYELWEYLLWFLREENSEKILLMEVSHYFIGLLKQKSKLNLSEEVDYWSFEKFQLEAIFCFLVNFLDRISTLYEFQKKAWNEFPNLINKEYQRNGIRDLTPQETKFLQNGQKSYNFSGFFLDKNFRKIDKSNFHKHYLSEMRNMYTHHSASSYAPLFKDIYSGRLALYKVMNGEVSDSGYRKKYNEEIVFASLYLILVVREMNKEWKKWRKGRK